MGAILKFDFQKIKTIIFFRRRLSKLHKKATVLHNDNDIFPKTRRIKNKQWTHLGSLKETSVYSVLFFVIIKLELLNSKCI